MITVIKYDTVDEYMEYERAIGAKDSSLIDIVKDDKCSVDDAMNALKVLKNSKFGISESGKKTTAKENYENYAKAWLEGFCCEKCGASVENSEQLTSIPVLRDYNNEKDVCDQLGTLDVCPSCLLEISNKYNQIF